MTQAKKAWRFSSHFCVCVVGIFLAWVSRPYFLFSIYLYIILGLGGWMGALPDTYNYI